MARSSTNMGRFLNVSLILALNMAIIHISHSHDPGSSPDDFLAAHQCIRKVLGLPPLSWDPELAKVALAWAEQRKDCVLIHSDRCGENMSCGWGLNGSYAVQMWLDERLDYDYNKNECIQMCGHYTQIVWKNTERVGCGRVACHHEGSYLVVCNYDPPGNVVGQWPY